MRATLRQAAVFTTLLLAVSVADARGAERWSVGESPAPAANVTTRSPAPETSSTPGITPVRRAIANPLSASLLLLTLSAAALAVRAGWLRRRRGLPLVEGTLIAHLPGGRRKSMSAERRVSLVRAWSILRAAAHRVLVLLIVAALVAGGAPAWAVDGDSVWNQSSGDGLTTPLYWFDGTNWLPLNTIPNGTIDDGFIADFSRNPLSVAQQTVTLDQDVTIGHLILGDLNGNGGYIFTGGVPDKKFIFSNDPFDVSGISILKRSGGNDDIRADIQIYGADPGLNVTVLTGGSNLTLSGRLTSGGLGNAGLNKYGGGTLRVTNDLSGTIVSQSAALAQFGNNLGVGARINVYAGTLESGASNYTLSDGTVWSSVFGAGGQDGTTIGLYGAQLSLRNNGTVAATAGQLINYGNNIDVVRDSVINLGPATVNVTNKTLGLGNITINDGTLVVNGTNGFALQIAGFTVNGAAARLFSNQNVTAQTMGGGASFNKFGTGTLTITGSTGFQGGINILQGVVFADNAAATNSTRVIVSPNTRLDVSFATAVPGTFGSDLFLASSVNSANTGFGLLSLRASGGSSPPMPNLSRVRLGPLGGIVALNTGTYPDSPFDQSLLGNGTNMYVTAIGNSTLTSTAVSPAVTAPLGAGSDHRYRLGSNTGVTLALNANNLLVGNNDLIVGMPIQRSTGLTLTSGTLGIDRENSYTGVTTIYSGATVNLTASNATTAWVGNRLGTGSTVNIFGTLQSSNQNFSITDTATFSTSQLRQTTFNLYGGNLLLDNSGVTTGIGGAANNLRIQATSTLNMFGGIFRFTGSNTLASSQTLQALNSYGQTAIDLRRTGATISPTVTIGNLVRGSGSNSILTFSNNNTLAFGSTGIVNLTQLNGVAPAVGRLPAYLIDATSNSFLSYSGSGIVDTAYTAQATLPTDATAVVNVTNGSALTLTTAASPLNQALALRASVTGGLTINGSDTLTIAGEASAYDAGTVKAGLIVDTGALAVSAPVRFGASGTAEAVIFNVTAATFSNNVFADGLTKGGAGNLTLAPTAGTNSNRGNVATLSGPITINAGTLTVGHQYALGGGSLTNPYSPTNVPVVNLWGGAFAPGVANTYFLSDAVVKGTSTIAPSTANSKIRSLTVQGPVVPITGTDGTPTSAGTSLTIGTNALFVAGNFTASGPTLLNATQNVVVEGGLTGTGSIDKWGNGTLALLGDSTSYSGNIRVYQGALQLQNGNAATVTPQLGTGMIDVMPGAILRITSPLGLSEAGAAADGSNAIVALTAPVDSGFGLTVGIASITLPAQYQGKFYHSTPRITVSSPGFANTVPAEAVADLDPATGAILGFHITNPGVFDASSGDPTIVIDIAAPGASTSAPEGSQLGIHSDRAGLGILSLLYGGGGATLPQNVQFYAHNGLYGGVVAIDTVGFTASLNLNAVAIHSEGVGESPNVFLGSTLGGTFQGFVIDPVGSGSATSGRYYLGGGGGLLNINTSALYGGGNTGEGGSLVYIGANSNLNVFESLNMALGGGNIALNNVQSHGDTSIQGGGTLTIGIHGALDSTLFEGVRGGLNFNGNTHPVFAASNSAIGLALLQPSTLLGKATLNPTLTIKNDIYFSGDLGVNTNNSNDVVFSGDVYLGTNLQRNLLAPTSGTSRFFNIGNTSGSAGRVYFLGDIMDARPFIDPFDPDQIPQQFGHDNQLIKQGVGVMHMSGTNTYTGNTHILAGFIALTHDNDIPSISTGQAVFLQGGGLGVWEAAPADGTHATPYADRSLSNTVIIYPQGAGPYGVANTLNGFGVFDIGPGLKFSQVDGSISGGGTLQKQGLGTLVLGANTVGDQYTIANAVTGMNVLGGVLQFNTLSASGDQTQPSAQQMTAGATTTNGSLNVTAMATTAGLAPGMPVNGTNIAPGTTIAAVTGATTLTLSTAASGAAGTLRFGGLSNMTFQIANLTTNITSGTADLVTVGGGSDTSALSVGLPVTGTGIPAGATITQILSPTQFRISANATVAGTTAGTFSATALNGSMTLGSPGVISLGNIASLTANAISAGMPISGGSIPAGTVILGVDANGNITISNNVTANQTNVPLNINGIAANIGNGGTYRYNYTNAVASAYSRNTQVSGPLGLGIDVTAGNTFYYGGSLLANGPNPSYMFRKTGTGTLVTLGTNTASSIEVDAGTWKFAGAHQGWWDNAAVTLAGGKVLLDGSGASGFSTKTAANIAFNGGGGIAWTGDETVSVIATDLVRTAQGTLILQLSETAGVLGGLQPIDRRQHEFQRRQRRSSGKLEQRRHLFAVHRAARRSRDGRLRRRRRSERVSSVFRKLLDGHQ